MIHDRISWEFDDAALVCIWIDVVEDYMNKLNQRRKICFMIRLSSTESEREMKWTGNDFAWRIQQSWIDEGYKFDLLNEVNSRRRSCNSASCFVHCRAHYFSLSGRLGCRLHTKNIARREYIKLNGKITSCTLICFYAAVIVPSAVCQQCWWASKWTKLILRLWFIDCWQMSGNRPHEPLTWIIVATMIHQMQI